MRFNERVDKNGFSPNDFYKLVVVSIVIIFLVVLSSLPGKTQCFLTRE